MTVKKTACMLCGNNCGLEVTVEDNRIVKVRGDKDNPRSQGYACRKGLSIKHYQHHADRLYHPLKRVGNAFEQISWDQAIEEIASKLSEIVKAYGPRSLATVAGGGSQGCPSQIPFLGLLLRNLGSQYIYSALAQELTGRYWVDGKTYGSQALHTEPHMEETDLLMAVGWNPMMSHHTDQSRRVLAKFSKDPDKLLVVVDPRRSETAKLADIHLEIRPGTDAMFYRAMISIVLNEGWQKDDYIDKHINGLDSVLSWGTDFDAAAALKLCELDYGRVREVCRLFTEKRSSHRSDLGVLMTRHSTLISYLETVFLSICGRIGVDGGNIFPVGVRPGGPASETPDEIEAKRWRTLATDFPCIAGCYPPNVLPEEILSDHPERVRAVIVSTANPLRSFADTSAYEKAFEALDLAVTVELSMTESAALSHYVLPARSGYESWDGGMRPLYPKTFMHFRAPALEPEGERLEGGEIYTRLADRLGLIPELPDALYQAADSGNHSAFRAELMAYIGSNPSAPQTIPFILAKTLGKAIGSVHLAWQWFNCHILPPSFNDRAAEAGFTPGPGLGEEIFQAIHDHPEGFWIGAVNPSDYDHFQSLATTDGRIHLDLPELRDWIREIDPEREAAKLEEDKDAYPLLMSSGLHWDLNANTAMRDPEWNNGKRAFTALMHPKDGEALNMADGQMVKVTTEAGSATIELHLSGLARPGYIVIPHGFGLVHEGKTYGTNANILAKNTHRDKIAATPLHRYIRCRVEAI